MRASGRQHTGYAPSPIVLGKGRRDASTHVDVCGCHIHWYSRVPTPELADLRRALTVIFGMLAMAGALRTLQI